MRKNINLNLNYLPQQNFTNGGYFFSPNHPPPSGMNMNLNMFNNMNMNNINNIGTINNMNNINNINNVNNMNNVNNKSNINNTNPLSINNQNNNNQNNQNKNPTQNRRLSESAFDKVQDNPLSNMMNLNMNGNMMNRSPPLFMKINPDMVFPVMGGSYVRNIQTSFNNIPNIPNIQNNINNNIPNIPLNNIPSLQLNNNGTNIILSPRTQHSIINTGFISPRVHHNQPQIIDNPHNLSITNNKLNNNSNNPISTIQKKIQNWEISYTNKINNSNNNNNKSVNKNIQNIHLQLISSHYDGLCNFFIFMKSCTPYISIKNLSTVVIKFINNRMELI
jgi:hypothetical protein